MKKIIFLVIILISLALPLSYALAQLPNLEIVYPKIPGDQTPPKVISEGLPDYVNYIYYFFFAIIGIIVLGALIYNGVIYLTSAGSPDKLMSAKKGIVAAFLGAIILFSSYFVFQSINPQLTVLEAEDPALIEPVITPGIYICNYRPGNVTELVRNYMEAGDLDRRIEAAKNIKEIIRQGDNICFRVAFSGNISFTFYPQTNAIFAIPRKEYISVPATEENPDGIAIEWKYDYGIIFHEKDNFQGKCAVGVLYNTLDFRTGDPNQDIFQNRTGYVGKIRSVTLFEWPVNAPSSNITLYQCLDYNQTGQCPPGLIGTPGFGTFPGITTADNIIWAQQYLLESQNLASPREDNINGTRSIKIDNKDNYFAILFSEDNFRGNICEVITENDNNLLDQPIGQCYLGSLDECSGLFAWNKQEEYLKDCRPCTNSMIVVKGNIIK